MTGAAAAANADSLSHPQDNAVTRPRSRTWSGEETVWAAARLGRAQAYDVHTLFRVDPPVARSTAHRAISELVRWHPQLRARYHNDGRTLWRTVVAQGPSVVWCQRSPDNSVEQATVTLDLADGPAAAFGAYLSPQGRVRYLKMVVHHIVSDRDSLRILHEDLEKSLNRSTGDGATHDHQASREGSAGLGDYESFARTMIARSNDSDPQYRDHIEHWRRSMTSGLSRGLPIRLRNALRTRASIELEDFGPLRGRDRRRVMSLAPWLAASYLTTAAATGSAATAVDMPSSLRPPECDRTVGYFVNVLPLGIVGQPEWTMLDVVAAANRYLQDAASHSMVPASAVGGLRGSAAAFFEYIGGLSRPIHGNDRRRVRLLPVTTSGNAGARYPLEFRVRVSGNRATVDVVVADTQQPPTAMTTVGNVFTAAADAIKAEASGHRVRTLGDFMAEHALDVPACRGYAPTDHSARG